MTQSKDSYSNICTVRHEKCYSFGWWESTVFIIVASSITTQSTKLCILLCRSTVLSQWHIPTIGFSQCWRLIIQHNLYPFPGGLHYQFLYIPIASYSEVLMHALIITLSENGYGLHDTVPEATRVVAQTRGGSFVTYAPM